MTFVCFRIHTAIQSELQQVLVSVAVEDGVAEQTVA
jgi:hypothetical protein